MPLLHLGGYVRKLIFTLLFVSFVSMTFAQSADGGGLSGSSAYSYSGTMNEQDQLKIFVYIWGQVRKPGMYIVPDDTDLLTVLSLAGGPTENAKLKTIRIVRQDITKNKEIVWTDLKTFIEDENEKVDIPTLKPGDTIIVSGTSFYAFARVADFLSKVAITLGVYTTIKNLTK
jgi:hypothetical protein